MTRMYKLEERSSISSIALRQPGASTTKARAHIDTELRRPCLRGEGGRCVCWGIWGGGYTSWELVFSSTLRMAAAAVSGSAAAAASPPPFPVVAACRGGRAPSAVPSAPAPLLPISCTPVPFWADRTPTRPGPMYIRRRGKPIRRDAWIGSDGE